MSGHTPGPWEVLDEDRRCVYRLGENGFNIFSLSLVNGGSHEESAPHEEQVANARLIAAAPELLEACQWFIKQLDDGVLVRDISRDGEPGWPMRMLGFTGALAKAVAAIAKAEG